MIQTLPQAVPRAVTDDERELVLRLRQGRPQALDELYRRHRLDVWRFLSRLAGRRQPGLAEDLFQDTWVAVARNTRHLREDTRLVPWLLTIARNKQRNSLRVFRREALERAHAEVPAAPLTPEVETEGKAAARAVDAAFGRLAMAHREVLLLSAIDGLDAAEIGAVLGLRADAARQRLSRARAELRRLLQEGER